ncbi:tyrosine-type recombinase/integrase [Microvirga alba]|uniref:Integrase arm-type DNA-binding domain-containing protein n=1 Tax=Microvirga alba TaxID=2791025 RepID=A0A931FUA7_9HYPH|nr:site-specific integrase [Microvirga alba]MBF9235431.1 integrase arm-type DNA-binding domain-containing protein [Microvirga alba]
MKRAGRHPDKALSALRVRQLSKPGRYADGNGLYLVVEPSGAKRWILRTVVRGKRRDIGLGGLALVSLAEAREKALAYRKMAREGGDPLAERRAQARIPTFVEAAELVYAEHKASWKNAKHAAQWITTLKQYAFPELGSRRVDQIDTPDVLRALGPIWLTKPETARRVRQRIGTVLDWAKAAGYRNGENPIDGVTKGLPKQNGRDDHHAALPYNEAPNFVAELRASAVSETVRLAFEFLILTACRTAEVLGATWSEVDIAQRIWTVPADRMKAGRAHRVPLSDRSIEILKRARQLSQESEYVFPGRSGAKPLSNMVFLMTLRRMQLPITAHGFRSSFRDWAAEQTNVPREVCEMALAHVVSNKVEAAYRRGDLFELRRELMRLWATFIEQDAGASE